MNSKRLLVRVISGKFFFFFLTISVVIFPRFFWRVDSVIADIKRAIYEHMSLNEYNEVGITPLMGAAAQGQTDSVRLLLDKGAKIHKKAKNPNDLILKAGNTALHYACLWGQVDVIKLLVDRGALEPIKGHKAAPLNDNGDTPMQTIVASEVGIELKKESFKALFQKDEELIKLMVNFRNKQGLTPLMRAVDNRDAALVAFMLEAYGKYMFFALKNKSGETALEMAIRYSADDFIKSMIKDAQRQWNR